MITSEMVHQFVEDLKKEEKVKQNLYEHVWISGSCTKVYPISIFVESFPTSEVVLQWKSDRQCNVFINKVVEKHKDILSEGYFWKSDGSCPSKIIFRLKERITC